MIILPKDYIHSNLLPLSLDDVKEQHLIITGSRGVGKSTGLTYLASAQKCNGIRTYAVRDGQGYPTEIRLESYFTNNISVVAATKKANNTGLCVNMPAFEQTGVEILDSAINSKKEWVIIDEIGFLESNCCKYCQKIRDVLKTKRLVAVVAKRDVAFLKELLAAKKTLIVDLDEGAR